MGSRLDGPADRKKDLDKRYDPKGGGTNPFQWRPVQKASLKIKQRKTKRTKKA